MRVLILGAGFSGLAACWFLTQKKPHAIHLYDRLPLGAGASGVAAGLLHPYVGLEAKLNWRGHEAFAASQELLQIAQKHTPETVYEQKGIYRVPFKKGQEEAFQTCAKKNSDVQWKEISLPGLLQKEGIWIEKGIQVFTKNYLIALLTACQKSGAVLLSTPPDEEEYDLILHATGAACTAIPLQRIKGQILHLSWPPELPPLPFPLIGPAYLVMHPDNRSCWVGSTYERTYPQEQSDPTIAKQDLFARLQDFFPSLTQQKILDCAAGIRAFTKNKRPLYQQLDAKTWVLTGMGSKGLLYHALMAKEAVDHLPL